MIEPLVSYEDWARWYKIVTDDWEEHNGKEFRNETRTCSVFD